MSPTGTRAIEQPAIEAIDLTVADGEIVGVVGPNEAGKSTLCLVASGLAPGSIGGELTGEVLSMARSGEAGDRVPGPGRASGRA